MIRLFVYGAVLALGASLAAAETAHASALTDELDYYLDVQAEASVDEYAGRQCQMLRAGVEPQSLVIVIWQDNNMLSRDQAWGTLALMMMHRCPQYLPSPSQWNAWRFVQPHSSPDDPRFNCRDNPSYTCGPPKWRKGTRLTAA